jgi:hypothetical protein
MVLQLSALSAIAHRVAVNDSAMPGLVTILHSQKQKTPADASERFQKVHIG